jgi:signal transduction histidine kinase
MASPWVTRPLKLGLLVSLIGVAAATGLTYLLREVMPVEGAVVVYLLPVLLASSYWGLGLGVATSILSALAFTFFHLPPVNSFALEVWEEDVVTLAVFLIVAGVTSALSATARRLAEQQAALRRVATQVAQAGSPTEIFESVTREVGLQFGADLARMERYEPDGTVTGVAAWSKTGDPELAVGTRIPLEGVSIAAKVRDAGQPVRLDSFARASGPIAEEARARGIRSSVGCPIVVEDRVWGVIAASSKSKPVFPADTEARIAEFTELVATAIAKAEAHDELIASRARIVVAADEARRRIQRDLHDGAQQRLVHAVITLKLARRALEDDDENARELVDEALRHAEGATEELRELSHGILPSVLARGGLLAGVESLVSRMSLPVQTDVCGERFSPAVEATAYFVVSEALTNVAKHAGAESAAVSADADGGMLRIEVRDDGAGGAQLEGGGSGLVGLHDRVAALEGHLEIESPPGRGTRIVATLPLSD